MDTIRICVVAELHLEVGGVALLQLGSPTQADMVAELVRGGRLEAVEVRELEGGPESGPESGPERAILLRLDARDG